jgi:hypothetical protein
MILAELLPQPNITQTNNPIVRTVMNDELMKPELMSMDENASSITSIKIPLASSQPILATSSKYILVNEFTKRKKQFVLFNEHLEKWPIRSLIGPTILDALWYENQEKFLLLTPTNIWSLDPDTSKIELIRDLIPKENRTFKCFTLLNKSTLFIVYDQWGAEYIDKWQENENGLWILMERQSLQLTDNEFIGDMLTIPEDDCKNLVITIYNDLTEQWRLEVRDIETFKCDKAILLPGSNITHDYRIISINNNESDIKWLVFSSANSNIIAIDFQWKKRPLHYTHPVQQMALFNEHYLIVRTTERIDIHSFI